MSILVLAALILLPAPLGQAAHGRRPNPRPPLLEEPAVPHGCATNREHDRWLKTRHEAAVKARPAGASPRGGSMTVDSGLVVLEDLGSYQFDARAFPLQDESLRFTRVSSSQFGVTREAGQFDPDLGTLVGTWSDWAEHAQALGFSFPFGNTSYTQLYASSRAGLFVAPQSPSNPGWPQFYQWDLDGDSTPRITPLLRADEWIWVTTMSLYVKTSPTTVTFTWFQDATSSSITDNDRYYQARVSADGEILFSYPSAAAYNTFGAVQVVAPGLAGPAMTGVAGLSETPTALTGPFRAAYTFGSLDPYAVQADVNLAFGFDDNNLDAIAVYQNFYTDITFYAGAYHTNGQPGATGIGVDGPRLQSLLHMNEIHLSWNMTDSKSISVLSHEFGHRWLYFVDGVGTSRNGAHPAQNAHHPAPQNVITATDSSCMGGGYWTDNGDGTFTTAPERTNYSYGWQDLYLMGLADPSEVVPWWYVGDNASLEPPYYPPVGATFSGTRIDLDVNDIVSAHGPRVPAYPATQRDFKVLFVLLTRPENPASPADIANVVQKMQVWEQGWETAVGDRASLEPNLWRFGLRGDIDVDGDVDQTDANLLADVLIGADADPERAARSDVNDDESLDGRDVDALIDALP